MIYIEKWFQVIKPDSSIRIIIGFMDRGYLCWLYAYRGYSTGLGLRYNKYSSQIVSAYFLKSQIEKLNCMYKIKNYNPLTTALNDSELHHCLVKLGKNIDGTIVVEYTPPHKANHSQTKNFKGGGIIL